MTQNVDDASVSLLKDAAKRFVDGRLIPAEPAVAALLEPDASFDALSLRTRAVHDPANGEWVQNGTKRYITNAPRVGLPSAFEVLPGGANHNDF
jgi:alkylation response protein AidB-like acyl-CoA dehydrogenase